MKMSYIKYLLFIVCGVVGCGSLFTSCQMEDLGPIPAEELYLRNFIKQYGLIDPNQDWNLAERSTVTVTTDYAKEVNVYVKIDGRYFRVAFYAEVSGEVSIPVDIPEGTDALYVEIDKKLYQTVPGGTVDAKANRWSVKSRDGAHGKCMVINTQAKSGTQNDWDNQFYITLAYLNGDHNFTMVSGDTYSISIDIARTESTTFTTGNFSLMGGGDFYGGHVFGDEGFAIPTTWQTISKTATYSGSGSVSSFNLDLGKDGGNTFYIDNVSLRITHEGTEYSFTTDFSSTSDLANYIVVNIAGNGATVSSLVQDDPLASTNPGTGGGSDPTPTTPTADATGIEAQLWWVGDPLNNGKSQIDNLPRTAVAFNDYFYQPNVSQNASDYSSDNLLSSTPKVASATATQMVMNSSNTFAYAQMYTPGNLGKVKVSFSVTCSEGGSVYVKPINDWGPGQLITSSGTYDFVMTTAPTSQNWPQIGIKWVSGDVTFTNMDVTYVTESTGGDTPGTGDDNDADADPGVENAGDMAWIIAGEDLGATDDFDFNDVIIRIESIAINSAALRLISKQWQVVEDNDDHHTLSRAADDHVYTRLKITSMCAGGILDSYLHFHNGTTDYVLMPGGSPEEPINLTPTTTPGIKLAGPSTSEADYEWHKWFEGDNGSEENNRLMLNTGHNSVRTPKSVTVLVPNTFSMSNYSRTFRDYGMGTGNTIDNFFNEDGKFIYDKQDYFNESWTYDKNDRIYGFYMTVGHYDPTNEKCQNIIRAPYKGRAPFMFLIPDVGHHGAFWRWAWERVSITDVYPNFKKWVTNAGNYTWYLDEPQTNQKTKEGRDVQVPYILRDSSTGYPSYN